MARRKKTDDTISQAKPTHAMAVSYRISCIKYSPDGATLAVASDDVWLLERDLSAIRAKITEHHKQCVWLTFLRNGTVIAVTDFSSIALWDVPTCQKRSVIRVSEDGWVYCVSVSPDGSLMASAANDGKIRLWDVETGQERSSKRFPKLLESVAFAPDGETLAFPVGSTIHLWDIAAWQEKHVFERHRGTVKSVTFSPDGRWIASAGYDAAVKLWDVASGTLATTFKGHTFRAWDVKFAPNGKILASAGWDGTARLWDISTGVQLAALPCSGKCVDTVAFSPDGNTLATGGDGQVIELWDITTLPS